MPSTRTTEIATGRPSGTALTDSAITKRRLSAMSRPLSRARPNVTSASAPTTITIFVIRASILSWTGLLDSVRSASVAILPNCVLLPVAVTTPVALPPTTNEPENSILFCS